MKTNYGYMLIVNIGGDISIYRCDSDNNIIERVYNKNYHLGDIFKENYLKACKEYERLYSIEFEKMERKD